MNKQDNVPQVKTVEDRATEIIRRIPVHPANFDYISKRQYGINGSLAQDIKYAMKEYAQPFVARIAELEADLDHCCGVANGLREERDKYREALEGIVYHKRPISVAELVDEMWNIAEQALNSKE